MSGVILVASRERPPAACLTKPVEWLTSAIMLNRTLKNWVWGPWSRLGLSIALAALVLDQAHKWWMLAVVRMQPRDRITITPFLDMVYLLNTGVSYSVGAGQIAPYLLATFSMLAAAAMTVWMARAATGPLMAASIGLIIGGAVGNAIDRVVLGGVADFFSLHAFGFYWYVFNIADVAIVAGVAGLLYDSFAPSRKGAAKASS